VLVPLLLAIFELSASWGQGRAPAQPSVAAEFTRAVALYTEHDDTGEALSEAEQAFAGVLARQPRHAPARAYQGLIALERDRPEAAEAAFRDALSIDAACAEAHVGRVRLLRIRGQWQDSYDEARRAVRLAPSSVLARWELVDVLVHRAEAPVGDTERNEAVPHLLRLIALEKAPRQAHFDLANLYVEQRKWREAIPHYNEVVRIGQTAEDSDVWVYEVNRTIAECYEKLGDNARAADHLQRYVGDLRALGASPEAIAEVERKIAQLRRTPAAIGPFPVAASAQPAATRPGILLEDLTWQEAEAVLGPDTVVVIPIGAQAKEHGPHLKLRNDFTMAEYFARRVLDRSAVIVAPTVNYHFYPAFVDYPGSTTLRLETARDLVVDICRSLARFGPRRFYALNTGVSTVRALAPAVDLLAADGILLRFTNVGTIVEDVEKKVQQQEGGTHADELETSMMLYIAPSSVDMKKAVKDYHPGASPLSRVPDATRTYSASGTFGDATLATREKGRQIVEAMVDRLALEIESLRKTPAPAPQK